MTATLDVARVQQALDALIINDRSAADAAFTSDLVLRGTGGCLRGRADGLHAVLERFADIAHHTRGTFGTEVEAVYSDMADHVIVTTRHWASVNGVTIHGTQALLLMLDNERISEVDVFPRHGVTTGIWD